MVTERAGTARARDGCWPLLSSSMQSATVKEAEEDEQDLGRGESSRPLLTGKLVYWRLGLGTGKLPLG